MVLHQHVFLDASVELLNLTLLRPHDVVLPVDLLEALHQLQLQERVLHILLVHALLLALSSSDWQVCVKSETVPGIDRTVGVRDRSWRLEVGGNHQVAHLLTWDAASGLVHFEAGGSVIELA
jgi:hypothetical protein